MSGYPHGTPGYGYGAPPPQSYGSPPPQSYGSSPYGGPPTAQPYAPYGSAPSAPYEKPPKDKPHGSGGPPPQQPGYGPPPPQQPGYGPPPPQQPGYGPPPPQQSGYPPPAGYGSPFASLVPSSFPPGTDPNVVACFQAADQDGSGFIDDKELQRALSSYNQSFSLRTVHLLMYLFTGSNNRKIGPKEFTAVFYSLQNWRSIFERFDRDHSGKIDESELREALLSLGFSVSPVILGLLVSKFDKSGGKNKAIEYDNFIECCLTVKGLTEKFKEKDTMYSGSATFTYESFMLTVLPFLIA
ncbi:calcium-binding protein CBP-like [Macadamia integrifolia]|uniref:calcium-binding protein CBP-like n=1 Tax=Macadamia integrifolia TaxID=60698 RepID=UPI001C52D0EB|nr:calcium-binding protein CBP-like [Macadamia integrifolia]